MLKCQLPWPHTLRRAGWLAQVRSEATCCTVSMAFWDVQAPLSDPNSALDQSMLQVNPGCFWARQDDAFSTAAAQREVPFKVFQFATVYERSIYKK